MDAGESHPEKANLTRDFTSTFKTKELLMNKLITIKIETAIRNVHWSTVQAGVKSKHVIDIDPSTRSICEDVHTGKTIIFGSSWDSIRDDFKVRNKVYSDDYIKFSAKGETATAVGVLPNINYFFRFIVYPSKRLITFNGCHDGYPSYNISVNGKSVYDYVQGVVLQLAGDGDVVVAKSNVHW